jgi:DNA-binding transcriptional MerR regulator
MFKIGDFSRLSQVSVKALRYYDEVGLLKPVQVDRWTGYRYYALDQLPRLNRILALKDLGLSLEQIAQLLDENLPLAQLQGMLRLKQAELQARVQSEGARLARVEARLRQIEWEGTIPDYEVVLKQVDALPIAAAREVVATAAQMPERCGALCGEISGLLAQTGARASGPWFAIYYNAEHTEQDIDVEMAAPLAAPGGTAPPGSRATFRTLPETQVAAVVHHDGFETILQAYQTLWRWMEANGYGVAGPCREIYLQGPETGTPVTEIQFPVARG